MRLDESSLRELAEWSDPIGILSIYVGHPIDRRSDPPPWRLEIKNRMRELAVALKHSLDRRDYSKVLSRFEGLAPAIEDLFDPTHGRGRALFAPIGSTRIETVAVQLELPIGLRFDRMPVIRPLVAALEDGRKAGLVAVHRDGAAVYEWKLESAEKLRSYLFGPSTRDWRPFEGQRAPNPGRARIQPRPQRRAVPNPGLRLGREHAGYFKDDHLERRVEAVLQRDLKAIAKDVTEIARRRGWERLVVFGDGRLSRALAEHMPTTGQGEVETLFDERVLEEYAWRELSEDAALLFDRARLAWDLAVVRQAKDLAMSRRRACLGLRDTLAALNESRIQNLLFDAEATHAGYRTIDGLMFHVDDKLARQSGLMLLPEPNLTEHMLRRALSIQAKLTTVAGDAARELEAHDGVAAILRW